MQRRHRGRAAAAIRAVAVAADALADRRRVSHRRRRWSRARSMVACVISQSGRSGRNCSSSAWSLIGLRGLRVGPAARTYPVRVDRESLRRPHRPKGCTDGLLSHRRVVRGQEAPARLHRAHPNPTCGCKSAAAAPTCKPPLRCTPVPHPRRSGIPPRARHATSHRSSQHRCAPQRQARSHR